LLVAGFAIAQSGLGLDEPSQTAAQTNPYEIKVIQKVVKSIAYVNNGWKDSAPCIQAELRVNREIGNSKPYARAYFFDRDNKLVQRYSKPSETSDDHRNYTAMPDIFKARQVSKVCFPIGDKATQQGEKWARVIVVFGGAEFATAESYPKDDISKFDFPEKGLALKSAKPAAVDPFTKK